MYISKLYREEDRSKILAFLKQNEFATLVAYDGNKPVASHLLFEVTEDSEDLFLNGHMSKANPLWRMFEQNAEVLVIFQGPHTYISPTWYNHVNVPTWNYQAVHLYGIPRIVNGQEYYDMISHIVSRHESMSTYRMDALPQDFVEKQMNGTVGFQVRVSRIEANYKLSQNRDDQDHHSIISHLNEREDEMSHAVAEAMSQNRPRLPIFG